jgi:hypothetical protein
VKKKRKSNLPLDSTYQKTDETIVKNTRQWYRFYAEPLHNFWKDKEGRKLEELFNLISRLYSKSNTEEKRSQSTVKDYFVRQHILPKEYLNGVICLLIETNFYQNFFEIGMIHRLDLKNTQKEARNTFLYLKSNVAEKEDLFWYRWIFLYQLQYEKNFGDYNSIQKAFENMVSSFLENWFEYELNIINDIYKNLYEPISENIKIINRIFFICLLFNYRAFLRDRNYNNQRNITNKELLEIEEKIENLTIENQRKLNDLKKYFKETKYSERYQEDFKLLELFQSGNRLIGKYVTAYPLLDFDRRQELLIYGENFIYESKPGPMDKKIYIVWYEYHQFLHYLRILEHSISSGHYEISISHADKCIDLLNKLDEKLKGGFLRYCIKIRYHRRSIYFIRESIDAYLLERSMEASTDNDYVKNILYLEKKDDSFKTTQEWIKKVYQNIFK